MDRGLSGREGWRTGWPGPDETAARLERPVAGTAPPLKQYAPSGRVACFDAATASARNSLGRRPGPCPCGPLRPKQSPGVEIRARPALNHGPEPRRLLDSRGAWVRRVCPFGHVDSGRGLALGHDLLKVSFVGREGLTHGSGASASTGVHRCIAGQDRCTTSACCRSSRPDSGSVAPSRPGSWPPIARRTVRSGRS